MLFPGDFKIDLVKIDEKKHANDFMNQRFPLLFWSTVICETKRNELKICNLRNGNMQMICKICLVNFAKSPLRS